MTLADKIITERKKLGLSQEELAEKLSVSRQAVSKWESAQSVPDIQKIIAMSDLFSVSTDYLLKDDILQHSSGYQEKPSVHSITEKDAEEYIAEVKKQSRSVSLGTILCIVCPIPFMLFPEISHKQLGLTGPAAGAAGLILFFAIIAVAVFLFVRSKIRAEQIESITGNEFVMAPGVSSWVEKKKQETEKLYTAELSAGIILCILSPLPLVVSVILSGYSSAESRLFTVVCMAAVLLCIIAAGTYLIIHAAKTRAGYNALLQAGKYGKTKTDRALDAATGIYWGIVSCVYLTWSFLSGEWQFTWIIWPVASVFSKVLTIIIRSRKSDN